MFNDLDILFLKPTDKVEINELHKTKHYVIEATNGALIPQAYIEDLDILVCFQYRKTFFS